MYKDLEETNKRLHKRLGELEKAREDIIITLFCIFCKSQDINIKNLTEEGIAAFLDPTNKLDPKVIFNRMRSEGMGWV